MSWESTALYYRLLNEGVRDRLGGHSSARCVLVSVDFAEIEHLQNTAQWAEAGRLLGRAAAAVQAAGADLLVLCTNTMHKVADQVAASIGIPLLHLVDATADAVRAQGLHRVGLLGTAFTMEQDFYKGRLQQRHGLDVIVPDEDDRRIVHEIIYRELVLGQIKPESRQAYRAIIARLIRRGAQAIILGCTEIMLLVKDEDSAVPLFDTTTIHAVAAVDEALRPTRKM